MPEQLDVVDAARPTSPGSADRASRHDADDERRGRPARRRLLVTVIFVAATLVMLRPDPSALTTHIPANTGDPAFYIWVFLWGNHAAFTNPSHFFDANIFWPHASTLAYADTVLPLIPVFGILNAITGSWALSLNLIAMGLVLLNLFATYALARHITGRTDAAVLGALAFGFSAYVFSHWGQVQLQTLGLLPLALVLLLKLLDRPNAGLAVLLGLVSAAVALAAVYDGASYLVAAVVIVLGHFALRRPRDARLIGCLALTAVVAVVVMIPVLVAYLHVQSQPGFRRPLDTSAGLHPSNLLAPAIGNYVWGPLGPSPATAGLENRFFPGLVATALAAVGAVVFVWRGRRPTAWSPATLSRPRRELSLLLLAGLASLVLAFGADIGGIPGPFRLLHDDVPGYAGVRLETRFALITLLAVAILASYGYAWLATRMRGSALRSAVAAGLGGLMLLELATPVTWAQLSSDQATLAPYQELAHRPPGAVVELPAVFGRPVWPYVDAPRMVYSSLDWHPRLSGYSAYVPPTLAADTQLMNTFPSAASLARARQLGIRYVILHVGTENGAPMLTPSQAQAIISTLPPGTRATRTASSWLVDLGPSR
ncbi:MAG TPA: hypothetical protein VF005_02955 [Acidimicrobiales bacterium]